LPRDTILGKPNLCRCLDGSGIVEIVFAVNAADRLVAYDRPAWTSRPNAAIADLPYVNAGPGRAKGNKRRGG